MQNSKLGHQVWVIAIYLLMTDLKGQSSMKLHRDLGVTQKTAWHLAHRIRETWSNEYGMCGGPVEINESYLGGLERNKHLNKRLNVGGGSGTKMAVVGIKDRETNPITAMPVDRVQGQYLMPFIEEWVRDDATVYRREQGLQPLGAAGNRQS